MAAKDKTGTALREKGFYLIGDERLPAISTLLNLYDKDATMAHSTWIASCVNELVVKAKAKQKHERWTRTDDGRWTMVLADPVECLLDQEWLKMEGFRQMNIAAERGSVCHLFAEEWQSNGGGVVPFSDIEHWVNQRIEEKGWIVKVENVVGYVESLSIWLDTYQPKIFAAEHTVFTPGQYAGTMDGIMQLGKRLYHFDYKATASTYPRHRIQVSAYRHAKNLIMDDGTIVDNFRTAGAAIIHIKPQGCVFREAAPSYKSFQDFKRIMSLYRSKERGHTDLDTNQELSIHKRAMDVHRAKMREAVAAGADYATEAVELRYWVHHESDCLFITSTEQEAEDIAMTCVELSADEYEKRKIAEADL